MVSKDDFIKEDFSIALGPVHMIEQNSVTDGGNRVASKKDCVERIGEQHVFVERLSCCTGK